METTATAATITLPVGKTFDRLLKFETELTDDRRGCGYQGYEFGANYLDSVCIQGYLWDADSGDADPSGDGWVYTNGGDIPCPHCNHTEWAEGALEDLDADGFDAHASGTPRADCPHPRKSRFEHLGELMRDAWLRGWDAAAKEP